MQQGYVGRRVSKSGRLDSSRLESSRPVSLKVNSTYWVSSREGLSVKCSEVMWKGKKCRRIDSSYWKSISSRERLGVKRKRAVCLAKISNNLTISDSISLQYACQYVHVTPLVLCDTYIASRTKPESLVYRKCFLTKQIYLLQFSGHR